MNSRPLLMNTRKTELPSAAVIGVFLTSLWARTAPFALSMNTRKTEQRAANPSPGFFFRPERRTPFARLQSRRRLGFSLMELLIVVAILLIIATIAVPKLNTARMHTQEMAAIRQIGTIHTAQTQYFSQFGRFAVSLTELGPPASGQAGPAGSDLLPGDLALGKKTGYLFQLQGTPTGYTVTAAPVTFGSTGRRTFFSDQNLVVRENWGQEPANASSKELQ